MLGGQRFGLLVLPTLPDRVYVETNEEFVNAVKALFKVGSLDSQSVGPIGGFQLVSG